MEETLLLFDYQIKIIFLAKEAREFLKNFLLEG
jgi:hypothetical protein